MKEFIRLRRPAGLDACCKGCGGFRRSPLRASGFTLIELMVVVAIIGIIAAIVAAKVMWAGDKAKVTLSRAAVKDTAQAVSHFHLQYQRYPERLEHLVFCPDYVDEKGWTPLCSEVPQDAWGRPLELRVPGTDGFPFDVVSFGADGRASEDDLLNHAVRAR